MARTKQVARSRYALPTYDWDLFWSRPTTKTLPTEILKIIVDRVNSVGTLFSLLTASKVMFTLASKALYRDPTWMAASTRSETRYNKFLDFMLACSPVDDKETKVLRDVRGIQRLQEETYADYRAMIRVFDMGSEDSFVTTSLANHPALALVQEHYRMDFRTAMGWMAHHIMWSALYNHFSNLERLDIPGAYVQLYIDVIPSLTNLRHVTFNLSRTLRPTNPSVFSIVEYHMAGLVFVERFIKCHGLRRLQSADFRNVEMYHLEDEASIAIKTRIQRLLGPPANLTTIDSNTWPTLIAYADVLDLSKVKQWSWLPDGAWTTFAKCWPNISLQSLMQQCRSLDRLETELLDPEVFQWAVAERRMHKTHGEPQQLVPLRIMNFSCPAGSMETLINDVIQGFGETLHECNFSTAAFSMGGPDKIKIGEGWWKAPKLTQLRIYSKSMVILHPDTLRATPALEQLILHDSDRLSIERFHELDNDEDVQLQPMWHLPNLWKFDLSGCAGGMFDPRSFAHMQAITFISLRGFIFLDRHIFPKPRSFADLHRPLWTWDIGLPNLTTLNLSGYHAARFRFRFLLLCPSLRSVSLRIGGHCVSVPDDLGCYSDDDSPSSNQDMVTNSCPTLRELQLVGRFAISDKALTLLFTRLCPRLAYLVLDRCRRFTMAKLVELCEAHPSLDNVMSRQITNKEMRALKLERPRPIPRRYRIRHETEIGQWYQRYLKSNDADGVQREEPTPVDGRVNQLLEPFCIYQLGGESDYYRRIRDL
ncbi:hypothetical protein BGW42_002749 [Actinomortierella wolfii]|nr:hypothetical protein BGW42_002749 [Actinomortierella wolfii]